MQYRHHLLTLSKGGADDTTIYFVVWWVLFECSSFDHFPYMEMFSYHWYKYCTLHIHFIIFIMKVKLLYSPR